MLIPKCDATPKRKSRNTTLVVGNDNKLYVDATVIMHPLVVLADGLPVVFFGDKGPYITIEGAVEWVENECKENLHYARQAAKGIDVNGVQVLEGLRKIKSRFDNNEMEIEE